MDTVHSILAIAGFVCSSLILLFAGSLLALLFTRRGEPYRQWRPWILFWLAGGLAMWAKTAYDALPWPLVGYMSLSAAVVAVAILFPATRSLLRLLRQPRHL